MSEERCFLPPIQQGDVLWYPVNRLPEKKKRKQQKDGLITFALGEATGHHHSAVAEAGLDLYEDRHGTLWCSVPEGGATVKHQEHKPVNLVEGNYRIGIVQEVDHLADEIRQVQD